MTKKKKGILIAVVAVIVLAAISLGLYFGVGPGAKNASTDNIAVEEGELYRTKTETFWAGLGESYISFQHKEAPAEKAADDKEIYGDVFYVMTSARGDEFAPWLSGYFNLDDVNDKLALTGIWDTTIDNPTKLTDAEPNVEKIYLAENGEYKISVDFPGGATVIFTLNPAADKVGNGVAPADDKTGDENTKSNADSSGVTAQAGDIQLTGKTEVNGVSCLGDMLIKTDNTWKLRLNVYNMGYQDGLWGSWSKNDDGSLVLKVTGSHEQLSGFANTINIAYNNATQEYSTKVKFTSSGFTFELPLNGKAGSTASAADNSSDKKTNSNKVDDKKPETVSGEYRVNMNEKGIYSNTVGTSYISFMPNGKFKMMVNAQNSSYEPWFEGTWKVNGSKLTISTNENGATGLDGAKNGKVNYTADKNGKLTIKAHFEGGGTASYTVDLNVLTGKADAPAPTNQNKPDNKPNAGNNGGNSGNSGQEAQQGDIKLSGQTETSGVPCLGDMLIKTDKTWKLQLNVYNMGYMDGLWGTWSKNNDGSLAMKVTGQNDQLSGIDKSFKVNYNSASKEYSTTVKFTSAGFTFNLLLNGKDSGSSSATESTVAVTGISLDRQTLELTVGKSATLTATVEPSNATNKDVNWTSFDEDVAMVSNGKVTAKASGITYIVVTSKDGGFIAKCKLTVTEPSSDNEYYVATTNDKWYGAFEMSIIFDNGTFYWHGQEGSPADDSWFRGTYSFNSNKTELTLNIPFSADYAHLEAAEANSSDTITLIAENGKFIIVIKDPSGASINGTFTLTVGSGSSTTNPDPEPQPEPKPTVQAELTAKDTIDVYGTAYSCDAKLDLYDDNTFKMIVDAGTGETEAASGTWALETSTYNIVLTVTEQAVANSLPESITLNIDYATQQYSGLVTFAASPYTVFNLNFAQAVSNPDPEPEPVVQTELTAKDTIDVYGTAYSCEAKLDLYDNNKFKMLVKVPGMIDEYTEAADGTWVLDQNTYNITLDVESQMVPNSLPNKIDLYVDYNTFKYSGTAVFAASQYTVFNLTFSN